MSEERLLAGRYRVLEKLGQGAMGAVYLAEHVRMGRRDAIKVLSQGMAGDPEAVARFTREARNASFINHPNVCAVYDFGETEEGYAFLAMEYVPGETLGSLLEREGRLPPERAAEVVRQAADALEAAHALGIIHRDLKPDNIMIMPGRGGSDVVKVVDFGIAKGFDDEAGQGVTRAGFVVGTPQYMSPEQLSGDRLDARSDVYSLAIVLFRMLSGNLPFTADTAQAVMIKRLTERPLTLAEAAPGVPFPEALRQAVQRALSRDREDRHASAAEFAAAVVRAVHGGEAGAAGGGRLGRGAGAAAGSGAAAGPAAGPAVGAAAGGPQGGGAGGSAQSTGAASPPHGPSRDVVAPTQVSRPGLGGAVGAGGRLRPSGLAARLPSGGRALVFAGVATAAVALAAAGYAMVTRGGDAPPDTASALEAGAGDGEAGDAGAAQGEGARMNPFGPAGDESGEGEADPRGDGGAPGGPDAGRQQTGGVAGGAEQGGTATDGANRTATVDPPPPPPAATISLPAGRHAELLRNQSARLIFADGPLPRPTLRALRDTTEALFASNELTSEQRAVAAYLIGSALLELGGPDSLPGLNWLEQGLRQNPDPNTRDAILVELRVHGRTPR